MAWTIDNIIEYLNNYNELLIDGTASDIQTENMDEIFQNIEALNYNNKTINHAEEFLKHISPKERQLILLINEIQRNLELFTKHHDKLIDELYEK